MKPYFSPRLTHCLLTAGLVYEETLFVTALLQTPITLYCNSQVCGELFWGDICHRVAACPSTLLTQYLLTFMWHTANSQTCMCNTNSRWHMWAGKSATSDNTSADSSLPQWVWYRMVLSRSASLWGHYKCMCAATCWSLWTHPHVSVSLLSLKQCVWSSACSCWCCRPVTWPSECVVWSSSWASWAASPRSERGETFT